MLTITETSPVIFACLCQTMQPHSSMQTNIYQMSVRAAKSGLRLLSKTCVQGCRNMQKHQHVHNLNLHANNIAAISTSRGILFSSNEMLEISLWKSTSCHRRRDVFRLQMHSSERVCGVRGKNKTDLRDLKHVWWLCFRFSILPLAGLSSKPVHTTEFSSNAPGVKTKPPLLWFFT